MVGMARVFWDTNLFIYLFEDNAEWSPRVIDLRQKMLARRDELVTSWLTVGEILTKPKELSNATLEKSYLNFSFRGICRPRFLRPGSRESIWRHSQS